MFYECSTFIKMFYECSTKVMKVKKKNTAIKERNGFIYLYYSYNRKNFYQSTGIRVEDKVKFKNKIDEAFNNFDGIIIKYEKYNNEYPTVEALKSELHIVKNDKSDFSNLCEEFVAIKLSKHEKLSYYKSFANYIYSFEAESGKIDINNLTEKLAFSFLDYMLSIEKNYKGNAYYNQFSEYDKPNKLSDNYIRLVITFFKDTIAYVLNKTKVKPHKIDWKSILKQVKLKKFDEECLSKEELKFLISKRNTFNNIEVKCDVCGGGLEVRIRSVREKKYETLVCIKCNRQHKNKKLKLLYLDETLDFFLFQCLSSLRFSDLKQIRKENVGEDFINIYSQKTSVEQIIPLNNVLRDILIKYNYNIKVKDQTYYNNLIKELLENLSDECISLKYITKEYSKHHNVISAIDKPRWARFSSHSGRHTACTLLYNSGLPINEVMKIVGHTDAKSTLRYVNAKSSVSKNATQILID